MHPRKRKMVLGLVKYISLILLMVFSTMWTDQLEYTEPQEAMPQLCHICYFRSEQPIAEKTITHLFSEQIAVPANALGESLGYHPHHSKPKCLYMNNRQHRYNALATSLDAPLRFSAPIHCHVIDYYIYTLEHILI